MNDADVLARAGAILSARKEAQEAEVKRLYAQYARKRAREAHHLGKPKRLLAEEALLLVALERNRYQIEAGGLWAAVTDQEIRHVVLNKHHFLSEGQFVC